MQNFYFQTCISTLFFFFFFCFFWLSCRHNMFINIKPKCCLLPEPEHRLYNQDVSPELCAPAFPPQRPPCDSAAVDKCNNNNNTSEQNRGNITCREDFSASWISFLETGFAWKYTILKHDSLQLPELFLLVDVVSRHLVSVDAFIVNRPVSGVQSSRPAAKHWRDKKDEGLHVRLWAGKDPPRFDLWSKWIYYAALPNAAHPVLPKPQMTPDGEASAGPHAGLGGQIHVCLSDLPVQRLKVTNLWWRRAVL